MDSKPIPDSRFRWNAGGWFGGMVGPTLSLPAYAVVIYRQHPVRALVLLGLFTSVLYSALWAWSRRRRFSARRAVLIGVPIVVAVAVAGCVIVYPLGVADPLKGLQPTQWLPNWAGAWWLVLLYLLFCLITWCRRAKRPSPRS